MSDNFGQQFPPTNLDLTDSEFNTPMSPGSPPEPGHKGRSTLDSLPGELLYLIARQLPRPVDVVSFAWISKRIFEEIGPENRYLWHRVRNYLICDAMGRSLRRITRLDGTPIKGTLGFYDVCPQPYFDRDLNRNDYKECIDIICGRYSDQDLCQNCFGPWEEYVAEAKPQVKRIGQSWEVRQLSRQDEGIRINSFYLGGIFYKRLCEICAGTLLCYEKPSDQVSYNVSELRRHRNREHERYQSGHRLHPNHHVTIDGVNLEYPLVLQSTQDAFKGELQSLSYRDRFFMEKQALIDDLRDKLEAIHLVGKTLLELYEERKAIHQLYGMDAFGREFFERFKVDRDPQFHPRLEGGKGLPHAHERHFIEAAIPIMTEYFNDSKDLSQSLRIQAVEQGCQRLMTSYFGHADARLTSQSLKDQRGLYLTVRRYIHQKLLEFFQSYDNCGELSFPWCVFAFVCWHCRELGTSHLEDGRELVYEDSLFVLHLMESHPDEVQVKWSIPEGAIFRFYSLGYSRNSWPSRSDCLLPKADEKAFKVPDSYLVEENDASYR